MSVRCSDPAVYEVTPRWRAVGLDSVEQVRVEVLSHPAVEWPEEIGLHVNGCGFCRALAASLAKMARVLNPAAPSATVQFAVCPSAETLARHHFGETAENARKVLESHIDQCPACQADERWLTLTRQVTPSTMLRKRWYFPVAAAFLFGSIVLTQHFKGSVPQRPSYADLVEMPPLDKNDLMATSAPTERPVIETAIADFNAGKFGRAEQETRELLATGENPAAELIMARAMDRRGRHPEAYASMLESERTAPGSEYRCWTLLQMALAKGDRTVVERECGHVSHHAVYGAKSRKVLEKVRARG